MQQLLKRLEIIRAAISLEDEETIALHLGRIRGLEGQDDGLAEICTRLDVLDYPQALALIDDFLTRHNAVTTYNDPEIAALKMELQGLEKKLADLRGERDEFLHSINDFNRQYSLRLGGVISEILKLQMMIAGAEEAAYLGDDEELRQEFSRAKEQAQQDYQQFHGDYQQQRAEPEPEQLDDEELKRLKTAYRKASRLCHPDMVADGLKEKAAVQFQALNAAYSMNDLARVEEILASLESGGGFVAASEQVANKEKLRVHISELRQKIDELTADIDRIQHDESWQLIVQLDGEYAAYFQEQEAMLARELARLQQQFREMV